MSLLILRRILWLIPTLLAVSFMSFAIIDLPPGDFLSSRIAALEELGMQISKEQVEHLRKRYNLDDSFPVRYIKWLNDISLFGFEREGGGKYLWNIDQEDNKTFNYPRFKWPDFGMSMAHRQPVTKLIGERILLTMTVSIFTLLLTWAMAIPIGIYSAVRQ